jgi:chromosome segregation ATPase
MREHLIDIDGIDLADFLEIIWRKKLLIIVPTFLLVLAVGVISFLTPPKWEVDAVIQPSKFLIQTDQGQFVEIVVTDPKQIAGQINQASYNRLVAEEIGIDIREFPGIKAENLRDTKLVRISMRTRDAEKGKRILLSLFALLKEELDKKINVEMAGIDTEIALKENAILAHEIGIREQDNQIARLKLQIKDRENDIRIKENDIRKRKNDIQLNELEAESLEIDKEKIRKEIVAVENKLKISEDRVAGIHEEMKTVKERRDDIDAQMRKTIAERKQGTDALSLLLYSNEVQQNLQYYNTLDEKLSQERVNQENMRLDVRKMGEELRRIDNQIRRVVTVRDSIRAEIENILTMMTIIRTEIDRIENQIVTVRNGIEKIRNTVDTLRSEIGHLENKKARIDYARLVKEPTSSIGPVSPRKKVNITAAGMAGLFLFTMMAVVVDRIQKRRIRPEDSGGTQ